MIWSTWRQFRTQTWIAIGALAALGVALVITGRSIADAYAAANVAACPGDCTTAIDTFLSGVTAGMLIRRTVPAMAATLAIYSAAAIAMQEWIRAHLLPALHTTGPLDTSSLDTLNIGAGNEMTVVASHNLPHAWVLSNQTITVTGQAFTGPANPQYCRRSARRVLFLVDPPTPHLNRRARGINLCADAAG